MSKFGFMLLLAPLQHLLCLHHWQHVALLSLTLAFTKLVHDSTQGSSRSVGMGESDQLDLFPMALGQIMICSR